MPATRTPLPICRLRSLLPGVLRLVAAGAMLCTARADELRGWWVDAFHTGLRTSSQVTQLVADARAANVNALFVQVRKRGDAYYNSLLEPKATDVSPQSFDPLADLLTKAHTGGPRVEVHAWIVTYNIWNSQNGTPSQTSHPYRQHPDWLTQRNDGAQWDGANYAFDPGHPEVQAHTFAVCQDILTRYAVDGLHFDYIRYTDADSSVGNQPWGYHPVSVQRFQKQKNRSTVPLATDSTWLQWRRDQVSALVRKVYLHAWKWRPQARISGAMIAYGSAPAGNSAAAFQQRDAWGRVLQDWRGWLSEGIIDTAIPMVYRDNENATRRSEFAAWSAWARDNQFGRSAAAGAAPYLNGIAGSIQQILTTRVAGSGGRMLAGQVGYSYAVPTSTSGVTAAQYRAALTNDAAAETWDPGGDPVYGTPAAVSAMPWKSDTGKGHLMGFVSESGGGPVFDGATVVVTGPVNRTLLTDATGFYGTADLPAGTYTVAVNVPGYAPQVSMVSVGGALVTEAVLTLTENPFTVTASQWNDAQRRMTLTWNSAPGLTYRVETSGTLGAWSAAAAGVVSQGYATTWTSAAEAAGVTRKFYRIVRE